MTTQSPPRYPGQDEHRKSKRSNRKTHPDKR
jgi:hypothetical protein